MSRNRLGVCNPSVRSGRHFRNSPSTNRQHALRAAAGAACFDVLEARVLLSAAFDLTQLTQMRADSTFSSINGQGVGVAVLDTGVFARNPDLQSNVVAFYD